jgi:hypothetical protein
MAYKSRSPVSVSEGGTGLQSVTNHGVIVGSGTSALTSLAVGSSNQTLVGVTGSVPAWTASPSFAGTVTATTAFVVTTGNLVATAGSLQPTGGISFDSGTNTWSVLTNVLTFGTILPLLSFGGASVGITYATQHAFYSRRGNTVFWRCAIVLSSKGSSVGTAKISLTSSFPVVSIATTMDSLYQDIYFTSTYQEFFLIANNAGTAEISLYQVNPTTGAATALTDANFANNTAFEVYGVYFT